VAVAGGEVVEELVAGDLLLLLVHLLGAVREDHVVQPLVRAARHRGVFADDVQVLVEAALPVLLAVVTEVQLLAQGGEDRLTFRHHCRLLKTAPRGAPGTESQVVTKPGGLGRGERRRGGRWESPGCEGYSAGRVVV